MPKTPCMAEGCGSWATYRGRCKVHARGRERQTHPTAGRTYDRRKWKATRRRYLFDHPLCECGCGRLAQDVHHKVAIEDGGDPWAMDNLQALTHACHARVTRQEQIHA